MRERSSPSAQQAEAHASRPAVRDRRSLFSVFHTRVEGLAALLAALLLVAGCGTGGDAPEGNLSTGQATTTAAASSQAELLHGAVNTLTRTMVRDIFSPPQASRAYAYASVAAYEALAPGHAAYERGAHRSLAGQLNGLTAPPAPKAGQEYDLALASLEAFLTVAQEMVYSPGRIDAFRRKVHARFAEGETPQALRERSVQYGKTVAEHILDWAAADRYKETRSGDRFVVTDAPGRWRPTPPAYMNAINPNWDKLRPFALDSAAQFKPSRPHAYSMEKGSPFYEQVKEVYDISTPLTEEQREIAAFWDCNPYAVNKRGHARVATKQMTPGGHWMAIATIAARKTDARLPKAAAAYARVGVTLADGFISAWDEKYRSNLVRPVTVINKHFDEDWRPILQTPPFPEYTSAHSVVSAAAATTLTDLYGDEFAFRDTSEVAYGLPVRSFDSFNEAAREAAVSRLYGGIHYRMAAENGFDQGKAVGRFLNEQVEVRRPVVAQR